MKQKNREILDNLVAAYIILYMGKTNKAVSDSMDSIESAMISQMKELSIDKFVIDNYNDMIETSESYIVSIENDKIKIENVDCFNTKTD